MHGWLRRMALVTIMALFAPLCVAAAASANPSGVSVSVERVSGPDRVATAIAVAERTRVGTADRAVLARADVLADALAGVPLAAAVDGPLLLTASDALRSDVIASLRRQVAPGGEILLLGGPSAISDRVETALRSYGFEVTRIAGADRVETSVAVASRLADDQDVHQAVIASGWAPADAIAVSAEAARRSWPILLSPPGELPTSVAETLHGLDQVTLVGGTSVLGAGVEASASKMTQVRRIAGSDRYATGRKVVERLSPATSHVVLASGTSIPDGLAAARLAASTEAALVLTPSDGRSTETLQAIRLVAPSTMTVVGGRVAVSDDAVRMAEGAVTTAWSSKDEAANSGSPSAGRIVRVTFDGHAKGTYTRALAERDFVDAIPGSRLVYFSSGQNGQTLPTIESDGAGGKMLVHNFKAGNRFNSLDFVVALGEGRGVDHDELWATSQVRFRNGFQFEPPAGKGWGFGGKLGFLRLIASRGVNDTGYLGSKDQSLVSAGVMWQRSGYRDGKNNSDRGSFYQGVLGQPGTGNSGNLIQYHYGMTKYGHDYQDNYVVKTDRADNRLESGRWYTFQNRVVMNDPGVANGLWEFYIDGVLRARRTDVLWRRAGETHGFNKWGGSTFFGGVDDSWAHTRNEAIEVNSIEISTTNPLP